MRKKKNIDDPYIYNTNNVIQDEQQVTHVCRNVH